MRLRLLFVDVAVTYINPTRNLLSRLAAEVGDVVCFGPGYVSSDTLRRGLHAFVGAHGPFDAVAATEHIVFSRVPGDSRTTELYRRNFRRFVFPSADLDERGRVLDDLDRLECLKVAVLLESDYYDFSAAHVEAVDQRFRLVATWGDQFFRAVRDLDGLDRESFAARATDSWYDFVTAHPERLIPLPHFIGDDEFCFTSAAHRPRTWCVPGTPYDARRRARQALLREGFVVRRPLPIAAVLGRLGLRPFSWHWFVTHYQETFRDEIRGAKYAFTCGSRLRYPLRKFFEIPAMGSVLVCTPCSGFEALGFRDGVSAFVCQPEALTDLGRRLGADTEYAQGVADAGRALVGARHSLTARAAQFRVALELAIAGRWRGATWQTGEMIPLQTSPPALHGSPS